MCMLNHISHVILFATLWSIACQASVSMEFSRQEYWSGLPCPPPGDPPDPAYCLSSILHLLCLLHWQVCSLPLASSGKPAMCAQSCPTLCDPMDCSLPGSSVHGISQARTLEWVIMPYSRGSSPPGIESFISCISRQIPYHLSHLGSPK